MKAPAIVAICLVAIAAPAGAQQFTVTGRVIENGGIAAIIGATVELAGRPPVLTGPNGGFTFSNVASGRYTLSVVGLGYAPVTLDVTVSGDTTLVIALDRAPIRLDSLVVETRDVDVRGEVRDRARDVGLLNAEVYASNGFAEQTDGLGRFRIRRVQANAPISIRVEEFGYLPLTVTLAPPNDTTIEFAMEPDPVVSRMIAQQKERIEERAAERRYPYEPPIDRDELIASRNGSVMDVVRRIIGPRPIGCTAIDERVYSDQIRRSILESMRPDEVEYIDALWYGPGKRSLMLRIYTRDFVARMILRDSVLISLRELVDGGNMGICR